MSVFVNGKYKRQRIKRLRILSKQYGSDLLCGVETKQIGEMKN